ncbi:lipid-A-disaccharide synthase-like uncharacterized protein [Bradyrhizobium sp. USDA 4449]
MDVPDDMPSSAGPVPALAKFVLQAAADDRANPELGLTGVLLFSGRHFAQFLEGAEADLNIMKASNL